MARISEDERRARSREYLKRDRIERPEVHRARRAKEHGALRLEVIAGYGGACVCCGNGFLPHLTIDHVNGGGADERRVHQGGRGIYRVLRARLRAGDRDDGYQVMCWNCNAAKHHHGRCECGG